MTTTPNPTDKADPVFVESERIKGRATAVAAWIAAANARGVHVPESERFDALVRYIVSLQAELSGIAGRLEAAEAALMVSNCLQAAYKKAATNDPRSYETIRDEIRFGPNPHRMTSKEEAHALELGNQLAAKLAVLSPKEKKT